MTQARQVLLLKSAEKIRDEEKMQLAELSSLFSIFDRALIWSGRNGPENPSFASCQQRVGKIPLMSKI